MAVKIIENIDGGLLGLWEITETTEQLLSQYLFQGLEQDNFRHFRNELRKREWLATRMLLKQMLGSGAAIVYDPNGKPNLAHWKGNISISHSSNRVVIFYHPELRPGIDIESVARNVERAARRFLSPEEMNDCTVDGRLSNKELMLRWCAKEAVFKMIPYTGIDFASQISCEARPFESDEGVVDATFKTKEISYLISLKYRLIGEIIMVWGAC